MANEAVEGRKKRRPARTPEEKDSILISLATDLAEKQLREGTASSQLICHYLKMCSARERLEQEKIKQETELMKTKAKSIENGERIEGLYKDAIDAMRRYSGQPLEPEDYD